ncbi:MAG: hypothetical protein ABH828_01950 [archaeon]
MKDNIVVLMDPTQREEELKIKLERKKLSHIKEDPNSAYCPISLTATPEEIKGIVSGRQNLLMNIVLGGAEITGYDPNSAPFSPDKDLTTGPDKVYNVDLGKIVGSRFFVGHDFLPSRGFGTESEIATEYIRLPVVLMDKNIRVSRMQPDNTIYLQYGNFNDEALHFIPVFSMLKNYDLGMGFSNSIPALLGFEKDSNKIVDLRQEVYRAFPNLEYKFDGKKSIVEMQVKNPEIFYENNK